MSTSERTGSYHHGDLRNALIESATEILAGGTDPAALSLREVARRAGVSAMAPYRHFEDRDALLAAVAELGFERLGAALSAADAAEDPREALVQQGVAYVRFACANSSLFRLMFGRALPRRHATILATGRTAYDVLANRVASLVPAEEAGAWAIGCWAQAHGIASLYVDGQLPDVGLAPDLLADRILRLSPICEQ